MMSQTLCWRRLTVFGVFFNEVDSVIDLEKGGQEQNLEGGPKKVKTTIFIKKALIHSIR